MGGDAPRARRRRGGAGGGRAPGARARRRRRRPADAPGPGPGDPPGPRARGRGRAGARRAPRGRPRRPPQLGRSTGRARLASRVAAAAGPPGARAPAGWTAPAAGAPAGLPAPAPRRVPPRPPPTPAPRPRGGGWWGGGREGREESGRRGGREPAAGWGGDGPAGAGPGVGGRRRLVQPRRAPSPASRPSPTDPALRANPYPEVTDPACRLPLPTLFQHARGCSPWRPAADMGTARREIYTLSPGFSRASESSPDAAGTATLSKARAPLSGRTHSRAPCPSQRKENSPGAPAGFSGIGCVTALDASRRPSPPLRIRGSEPDSLSIGRGQRRPSPVPSERRSPISQDRLTHVQLLFTWNPSPLRPSKFSFEYLLLPPRSAPAAAPPGPAP